MKYDTINTTQKEGIHVDVAKEFEKKGDLSMKTVFLIALLALIALLFIALTKMKQGLT